MVAIARGRLELVGVFAVALALRLGTVLTSAGGIGGDFGYDPGVYYASADALTFGRLPYRDYILLHPPGLTLALTPFALLGRIIGDHWGFVVATAAFEALGALNAMLVALIAQRLGLGRVAAVTGGLFYAVWFGAVQAELTSRLEPLGSTAFLVGLLLLLTGSPRRRRILAGGAALAFAVSVKVWWIVPAVVVVAWWCWSRRTERDRWVLPVGVVAGAAVVDGPFLLAAPAAMWRMIGHDQLGRARTSTLTNRIKDLTTIGHIDPTIGRPALALVLVVLAVLVAAVAVTAWSAPRGRLFVVLAAVQVVVLALSPTYFYYYAGYLAGPAALVVAAGAHRARLRRAASLVAVAVAAALTATMFTRNPYGFVSPSPGPSLAAAVASEHCMMADTDSALIAMDALSRDLSHGCPNWVDITGRTYDRDASPRHRRRRHNPLWQRDIRRYLLSGDAVLVTRPLTGLSAPVRREIGALPVLARSRGWVVHTVPPADRTTAPCASCG